MTRQLQHLKDEHLKCRGGYNHGWDDCPPPIDLLRDLNQKPGCWQFWLRCGRCEALRLDVVSKRTGALENRRYWLPDGYSDASLRGLRREAYRRELGARRNGNGR